MEEVDLLLRAPGRGGVSRGRGDAPLSFGKEPAPQQERFKEERIEGRPTRLAPGELLAIQKIDPDAPGDEPAAVRGGARGFTDAEAEAAWKRRVPPRDRGVVRRYFSEPGGKEGKEGK